jgi:hypothetical protein
VIKQSPELMKAFTNATVNSMSQQSPGFEFANNFVQEQTNTRGPPPPTSVETKNHQPTQRPGTNYNQQPTNRPDINVSRGIDMNNYQNMNEPEQSMYTPPPSQSRPEMRGPKNTDIDNILSGLKTRTVNIHDQNTQNDNDSLISINSLKDIQNNNMPKKTNRRKNKSDKNIISLDI